MIKSFSPWLSLLAFVCATSGGFSQGYQFATGAGVAGQAGTADGTNGVARFEGPAGIVADNAGNVYVADTLNHTIRKLTRVGDQWAVRTIAGLPGAAGSADGTNTNARFFYPAGIAVDLAGTLYVADTYNHTIRKLVASGPNWVVSTLAGTAGVNGSLDAMGASASFNLPSGIASDSSGHLYVADTYNHTIRQVAPDGDVTTLAGLAGATGVLNGTNNGARFYYPFGVAVDSMGNIFVADTYNSTVRGISLVGSDWIVSTLAGIPRLSGTADGTNRAAQFNFPFGISVNGTGKLLVADTFNHTIRALAISGTNWAVTTVAGVAGEAGSTDGAGSAARFSQPHGITIDSAGNLLVADTANNTIRVGSPGVVLQCWVTGNQFVVSWPASASGYLLESRNTFAPGGSWVPAQAGTVLLGDAYYKTNLIGPGQAFFRLHR